MLEQLMQTAVQYIDTVMVGSLGTVATAAVGCTTTVNWLVGSTLSALGVGFLACISKAIGARDIQKAKAAASQAVLVTLAAGLVFTAVTLFLSPFVPVWMNADGEIKDLASQYFFILYTPMLFRAASIIFSTVLRAAGDTKTPMRVGIGVNIINCVLNFVLIYPTTARSLAGFDFTTYGAGLGVRGAAAASAVAYAFGGIMITVSLFRHKTVAPQRKLMRSDKALLKECMKVALPNMGQRFCTSLGYVFFASMINSLGSISTAAHTVANTVESAFYIPGYGMQTAAATLTGNCIGAKDNERMKRLSKTAVITQIVMMSVSGALLFIFAPRLVALFSKDENVIALGAKVLRMVAVSEPFYGVSIVTEGMLQGAGKTVLPFVFNIICMWGVRIAGTFVCTRFFSLGLIGAWGCMIADNMLLLVLFRIYYRSDKWNPIKKEDKNGQLQ